MSKNNRGTCRGTKTTNPTAPRCADEILDEKPCPEDYAYRHQSDICTNEPETDEDPLLAVL